MLLLSKAKKSANIRNSMFNDLSFSKDVKINSIISQGRSFSLPDINESKITISQDNSLVMCNMKEKALHKSKMSRIEQIAEVNYLRITAKRTVCLIRRRALALLLIGVLIKIA